MKKFFLIAFVFACVQISFAAFPPPIAPAATDNTTVVSSFPNDTKHLTKEQKRELMERFSKMSVSDVEKMTGKKMNGLQKLSLKLTQHRMKQQLKRDAGDGLFSDFNVIGFILGLFVGLIGVLIAYLAFQDSAVRKWSWIGFGVFVILYLILLAAVL